MKTCPKFGITCAGTYRCHAYMGKCNEPEKTCPMKDGDKE